MERYAYKRNILSTVGFLIASDVFTSNINSAKDIGTAIGLNYKLELDLVSKTLEVLSRHHVAVVASMYLFSIVWFVMTIGNSNYVGRYFKRLYLPNERLIESCITLYQFN